MPYNALYYFFLFSFHDAIYVKRKIICENTFHFAHNAPNVSFYPSLKFSEQQR